MQKKNSFMEKCEKLETSDNFKSIRGLQLENMGEKKIGVDMKKFESAAKESAEWFKKTYGKK